MAGVLIVELKFDPEQPHGIILWMTASGRELPASGHEHMTAPAAKQSSTCGTRWTRTDRERRIAGAGSALTDPYVVRPSGGIHCSADLDPRVGPEGGTCADQMRGIVCANEGRARTASASALSAGVAGSQGWSP